MIKSMTGYGRGELNDDIRSIVVEMRSVNHGYFDVNVRMPHRYAFAEKDIVALVKEKLFRGKIEVSVRIDMFKESDSEIRLNIDLADKYYAALKELSNQYVLQDDELTLRMLAGMPDVIKVSPKETDKDEVINLIKEPLKEAIEGMCQMRKLEGEKLATDIIKRAEKIDNIRQEIEKKSKDSTFEYRDKLTSRIKELTKGNVEIPEDRIALEAAILADKSDVTEETVRLKSHVRQLERYVNSDEPALGKKIDFLVQEMNRETNTIGSKASDDDIINLVIELKAEIEKIREQVQNIE